MALSDAERLRLIYEIRRKEDPCRQMVLTPSQRMADESRARYIGIRGGNRSGKSSLSAKKLSTVARRLPDCKTTSVSGVYLVFAPSRSQISDPWGKKLLKASEVKGDLFEKPFIPPYEIANIRYTYGAGEPTVNLIELKNGNQILFCVSGDKNVWKRIEGKGMILGIVFDESAGTEQLLEEAMTRLLDANSNEQVNREAGGAWVLWGATQTKKSPAFERFLALGQSGANPDYAAFDLLPGENPAIDQAEREKMSAIMSKDAYEIRMLGHGSAAGAMALYPQWDDERNLAPLDDDYVPAVDDGLWLAYDPGSHYTGIVVCAINRLRPRCLRAVQVWQPQRTTIEHDMKLIRDWLGGRALEGFVYDQAARKMEKVGNSVIGKIQTIINTKGSDIRIHRGLLMGRSEYQSTVPIMRQYLRLPPGHSDGDTNLILNRGNGCDLLRWQLTNCAFTEKGYELKESQIASGHDHCLIAGTMIETPDGPRPIEDIAVGDLVCTRNGPYPVLAALSSMTDRLITVEYGGQSLTGTANHRVMTASGWKPLERVRNGDMILTCNEKKSPTAAGSITGILSRREEACAITTADAALTEQSPSTERCGSAKSGRYQPDSTSITLMEIRSTTSSPILPACTVRYTSPAICESVSPRLARWSKSRPTSGSHRPCGTAFVCGKTESKESSLAECAERNSRAEECEERSYAAERAVRVTDTFPGRTTWTPRAPFVERRSGPISTGLGPVALEAVTSIREVSSGAVVYNLTVLGPSEYFANKALTHNCSDALRYLVSRLPTFVDRGPNPKLWGEGSSGTDPDATRRDHGDTTPADHTLGVNPVTVETSSPAERQRRTEAAKRERRLKASRSIW